MLLNYFSTILISIIQGLTEFLPISSSAHIIIFAKILNIIDENNFKIFEIIIQLGSTLAIFLFFFKKIKKIITNTIKYGFFYKKKLTISHIIISTIPTILMGLIFYHKIKIINNIHYIIYGLCFGSFLLYFSEQFCPKKPKINNINYLTYKIALLIGISQCFSLFPGVSRSGSILSISKLIGINRPIAIEFCFIISIPIVLGANILELCKHYFLINITNIKIFIIGFIISFIISLIVIKRFLCIIKNVSLKWFSLYRLFLVILLHFFLK
ncbi:undecaprenyl-diphosphatase [Enterobacteriaceae endosymbiont of Donacia tomentosa]|nr:undecaprenyl-diphosphatase [Enterobacteriaceae endosymbiont of Donacia tomentosa]